jgi:aldehyde:ferredoxin oxidoreductase
MIRLTTGLNMRLDELLAVGERVINLKRVIINKLGITRKDDTLPERILKESLSEGGTRGWDENGVPTPEKLGSLGINMRP